MLLRSKMPGQKLSPAQAARIGEERESWCAVTRQKEEDWCRKERKHHPEQFTSCVFKKQITEEPRCTFQVDTPTHKEKRHFPDKYSCQWKI